MFWRRKGSCGIIPLPLAIICLRQELTGINCDSLHFCFFVERYCSKSVLLNKVVVERSPKPSSAIVLIRENRFNPCDSVDNTAFLNFVASKRTNMQNFLARNYEVLLPLITKFQNAGLPIARNRTN